MKKIFLIPIIAVLLLVGCSGNTEDVSTNNPFLGGNSGLLLSFVEGAPPLEVYDGGDYKFDIELQLDNKGEAEISAEDIIVKIDGISSEEFGISSLSESPESNLRGAEKDSIGNRIEGDSSYVLFSDLAYENEIIGASLTRPIVASVCYNYETNAIADVCILSDLTKESEVCVVDESKKVFSSSGPVQVTSFLEKNAGKDKVEYQFVISSSDEIYEVDSECSSERSAEDVVKVSVNSGLSGLDCSGLRDGSETEGFVTLRGGSFTVRCVQELSSESDYETSLEIKLNYAVKDSVKKEITIKPSN